MTNPHVKWLREVASHLHAEQRTAMANTCEQAAGELEAIARHRDALLAAHEGRAVEPTCSTPVKTPILTGEKLSGRERLRNVEQRLRDRGVTDIKIAWGRLDDTPLSGVVDDVASALETFLDGRTRPLPPLDDSPEPDGDAV